jgi:hypothetical protein
MIRALILRWARNRKPDFVIGGKDRPYLRRHWLLPRNRFFNVYVHQFLRSDDDRALHTHPWLFNASWLLEGRYIEWVPSKSGGPLYPIPRFLFAGQWKFRWGDASHRIQLYREPHELPCWTVFITGPRVREWGFHCPKGFIPWQRFTASDDPGAVGKGCDA